MYISVYSPCGCMKCGSICHAKAMRTQGFMGYKNFYEAEAASKISKLFVVKKKLARDEYFCSGKTNMEIPSSIYCGNLCRNMNFTFTLSFL